ncbi:hypothetical protein V3C99_003832 [Haemonchus contortus]
METTPNATDGTNVTSLLNATDDTNVTSPRTAPMEMGHPVKRSHLESEDHSDQDSDVSELEEQKDVPELEKQKDVPELEIRAQQEIAYRYGGRATFPDEGFTTEAASEKNGPASSDSERIDTVVILQEGRETIGKPCSVEHMSYIAKNEEAGCTGAVEFSNEVCEAFFKCMSGGEMLLTCRNMVCSEFARLRPPSQCIDNLFPCD